MPETRSERVLMRAALEQTGSVPADLVLRLLDVIDVVESERDLAIRDRDAMKLRVEQVETAFSAKHDELVAMSVTMRQVEQQRTEAYAARDDMAAQMAEVVRSVEAQGHPIPVSSADIPDNSARDRATLASLIADLTRLMDAARAPLVRVDDVRLLTDSAALEANIITPTPRSPSPKR